MPIVRHSSLLKWWKWEVRLESRGKCEGDITVLPNVLFQLWGGSNARKKRLQTIWIRTCKIYKTSLEKFVLWQHGRRMVKWSLLCHRGDTAASLKPTKNIAQGSKASTCFWAGRAWLWNSSPDKWLPCWMRTCETAAENCKHQKKLLGVV